ncbi:hypothetical protein J4207_01025 [Candidatus Woesearchaeota archaeon]|nr:hypothetical protein [Candidatus Woesearchaeota archaeon]
MKHPKSDQRYVPKLTSEQSKVLTDVLLERGVTHKYELRSKVGIDIGSAMISRYFSGDSRIRSDFAEKVLDFCEHDPRLSFLAKTSSRRYERRRSRLQYVDATLEKLRADHLQLVSDVLYKLPQDKQLAMMKDLERICDSYKV